MNTGTRFIVTLQTYCVAKYYANYDGWVKVLLWETLLKGLAREQSNT